jgi:hypothetical protein
MSAGNFVVNDSRGVKITIRGEALDEILRSPDGEYCRDLMRRMEILQSAARRQIRLGHIHGGGGYGNLRDSIVKRLQAPVSGTAVPMGIVGSSHPIALIHHEGTRPHVILPVKARALRFPGNTQSGWVFAKIVHHPGTRPNRYLTDNLPLIAR